MKPIGNNILVAVNLTEKNDYEITTPGGLKLFMFSAFGYSGIDTGSVYAKVLDVSDQVTDIKAGDIAIVHFNAFKRSSAQDDDDRSMLFGNTGEKHERLNIFRLERAMVWGVLDEQGDLMPMKDILIVERLEDDIDTFLIVPDSCKKKKRNEFKVVRVGSECEGIEPGDVVICYEHSDLAVKWSFNGTMKEAYRVKYDDVLAKKETIEI